MTILVSAGGTGGGIYPALAVVAAIHKLKPSLPVQFVGSPSKLDRELIEGAGVPFSAYYTIQAGPLHGVNPLRGIVSISRLTVGLLQSLWLLARSRPQAAFLTGGWIGAPIAVAAWIFRVPIIIFVPDIEPGQTLKLLGRFAHVITATTADTETFFPGKKLISTGYPLREEVLEADLAEGIKRFGLEPNMTTLLVFGGSRGARSINRALTACAPELVTSLGLQILHVSGSLDWPEVQEAHRNMSSDVQARYHVYEYLHDMGLAMAAADLVVSRAGASTLGEFPYFGLPAILVPYPYAWRYQKVNADWLVSRGAAFLLEDERLETDLAKMIRQLVEDSALRERMRAAAQALAVNNGAENIAEVILEEIKR